MALSFSPFQTTTTGLIETTDSNSFSSLELSSAINLKRSRNRPEKQPVLAIKWMQFEKKVGEPDRKQNQNNTLGVLFECSFFTSFSSSSSAYIPWLCSWRPFGIFDWKFVCLDNELQGYCSSNNANNTFTWCNTFLKFFFLSSRLRFKEKQHNKC